MYDVFIARLIPIIKLTFFLDIYCNTICSVFVLYEIKKENKKKKKIGKKTYFLALGMGPNFGPKIG